MPSPSPAPSPPVSPKQEYKAVKEEEEVLVKEEPVEKAMFEVKEEPCPMKVEVKSVDVSNEQEPGEIKDEAVEESEDVKNEERSRESSPVLDRAAQLLKMEVTVSDFIVRLSRKLFNLSWQFASENVSKKVDSCFPSVID